MNWKWIAVSALSAAAFAQVQNFKPVTEEMLKNPSPNDWLMYNRTYDAQRFSPLKQINKSNVKRLVPIWNASLMNDQGELEVVVGDFVQVWIGSWTGGRTKPLEIYGPSGPQAKYGIRHFVEKQMESYAWDTLHADLRITISIGVCADTHLKNMGEMVSAADKLLYKAKQAGRNRVCSE